MALAALQGCSATGGDKKEYKNFNDYWRQGKAELTSYKLEQARYGEMRQGHAVAIFVTEDFSRSKQVKLDDPAKAGSDAVGVLKLNLTRKFNTGIYPYSLLQSVFTPLDDDRFPHTLKTTASVQEWCGQTFTQLNFADTAFRVQIHSYFESEGEQDYTLPASLLEDEIWTVIRLAPGRLPKGEITLIPGSVFARLMHRPIRPEKAMAELLSGKDGLSTYTLTYKDIDRTLSITFTSDFPYTIESWEETYMSGWGDKAGKLTTRAVKEKRMLLDYWNRNANADAGLRRELGLD